MSGAGVTGTFHPSRTPYFHGLVAAIHGGGFDERYFDVEGYSTVKALTGAGLAVLTPNRPGYGGTPGSDGASPIRDSVAPVAAFIERTAAAHGMLGRTVLLGHSIGGAVALEAASVRPDWLAGVTVSGIGDRPPDAVVERWRSFAHVPAVAPDPVRSRALFFGADDQFDPAAFAGAEAVRVPSVQRELIEIATEWPARVERLARTVCVPVQIGLADGERLWLSSRADLARFAGYFSAARVDAHFLEDGAHLYEFHHGGPAWIKRQVEFALRCVGVTKSLDS